VSAEKPLHVQAAEALGWSQMHAPNGMWPDEMIGYPPELAIVGQKRPVPRYDEDWSATGPLIEKYGLALHPGLPRAATDADQRLAGEGDTYLIAVCHLILALHAAGKLEAVA
jgi:hypothetical protein